jgi:hypothetical protein
MRPFLIMSVTAVLACCLALALPVKPAMAGVTAGPASCSEGKIKQMGNGVGCVIPLKVRPPDHARGTNPNDWGLCGFLSLSGSFDASSVVRIIVDTSGYYGVELAGSKATTIPTAYWTCVLFTDFKKVPPASPLRAVITVWMQHLRGVLG